MPVKKGGLQFVIDSPKSEWILPIKINTILSNIEVLLDFICMVKFIKEPEKLFPIIQKLSDLYIILIK